MDDPDFWNGLNEDEEYHCEKCGKVFSMRVQNDGRFDYDEGTGCCQVCHKVFCEDCGNWHAFGERYEKICLNCFNEKILYAFEEWLEIFDSEYCHNQCDDCFLFFKKGCMMQLLHELIEMTFYTDEIRQIEQQRELNRIQRKNREAEKEWEKQLREFHVQPSEKRRRR